MLREIVRVYVQKIWLNSVKQSLQPLKAVTCYEAGPLQMPRYVHTYLSKAEHLSPCRAPEKGQLSCPRNAKIVHAVLLVSGLGAGHASVHSGRFLDGCGTELQARHHEVEKGEAQEVENPVAPSSTSALSLILYSACYFSAHALACVGIVTSEVLLPV